MGELATPEMSACGNYYLRDGLKYLRVSRVLDFIPEDREAHAEWRGKVGNREANRVLKEAEKIGKETDALITKFLTTGAKPSLTSVKSPQVASCWQGFQEWYGLNQIRAEYTQLTVFDDELMVAGTIDCIIHGEILDWKCTGRIKLKHIYQVLIYWWMAMTTMHLEITRGRIVRFDKQLGTFEEKPFPMQMEMLSRVCDLAKFAVHWYGMVDLQQGGEERS